MPELHIINQKPVGSIVPILGTSGGGAFRTLAFQPITLDALVSESHQLNSDVSEHPVEKGAAISDHVRPTPVIVTVEGLVSNTPVGETQRIRAQNSTGLEDGRAIEHSEDAFRRLEDIRNNSRLVTLVTPLKTYTNMAMQSLTVPRDRATGDALRFTAVFKQIRVVENKEVVVQVPRARKKASLGTKSTAPTPEATTLKATQNQESILSRLVN